MKYKELHTTVKMMLDKYFLYRSLLLKNQNNSFFDKKLQAKYKSYNDQIYLILTKKLNLEAKRILFNEFVSPTDKYWWYKFYSKTTFYRLARKSFLEFLNFINEDKN